MRVAVATDNGQTLALHAGRARMFLIYDVDEDIKWKVIKREERPNPHREFVMERHRAGLGRGFGGHGEEHPGMHGHGGGHEMLFKVLSDCNVILAGGMGPRLADDLAARGIKPMVTTEKDIARAIEHLIGGELKAEDFCREKGKGQTEN